MPDDRLVIADFGCAKNLKTSSASTFTGTDLFRAPEVFLAEGYTHTCDIWSFGIIMAELMDFGTRKEIGKWTEVEASQEWNDTRKEDKKLIKECGGHKLLLWVVYLTAMTKIKGNRTQWHPQELRALKQCLVIKEGEEDRRPEFYELFEIFCKQ
jgi:serine/threonine protein kinase